MNFIWNHRQLPELAIYDKKQKDKIWQQCIESYGRGKLKYIFIGYIFPSVFAFLIYWVLFAHIFPFIAAGYMRLICAGLIGALIGVISSTLRIHILRSNLQNILYEQKKQA
jgi:sensor histidine kinase YesM